MKKTVSLLSQPAPVLDTVLGRALRGGRRDDLQGSCRHHRYCHLKFPAMREDTLSWERPVLDSLAGNIVDFYGPCDYDPLGLDEIRVQRRVLLRGNFDDGD